MDDLTFIYASCSTCEILAHLAKESLGLGRAALKLCHSMRSANPAPSTIDKAFNQLIEKHASVCMWLSLILDEADVYKADAIVKEEAARWRKRLEDRCHEEAERL